MNDARARLRIDIETLHRIASRDESAFSELYDRLSPILYALTLRILGDEKLAEDALQDSFLQIWDKASSYNEKFGSPITWLLAITRNKSIEHLRRRERRRPFVEGVSETADAAAPPSTVEHPIIGADTSTMLRAALNELSHEQRHAIELAYFSGLTQQQIADLLNEPLGTIKARVRRGLLSLREFLEDVL